MSLPNGAYEAIFAEHERDHLDAGASRDGCNGCAMLAYASDLRTKLADMTENVKWVVDLVEWDVDGSTDPRDRRLSWESVARLAIDYAKAAYDRAIKE